MTLRQQIAVSLQRARNLIANRSDWCTGHYALDVFGKATPPVNDSCVAFCASGAVKHATKHDSYLGYMCISTLVRTMIGKSKYCTVTGFNDNSTHTAVLRLFDEAIREQSEGGNDDN